MAGSTADIQLGKLVLRRLRECRLKPTFDPLSAETLTHWWYVVLCADSESSHAVPAAGGVAGGSCAAWR